MRQPIVASPGHVLTDGVDVYGYDVYLAEGENADKLYEITEEEYQAILSEEARQVLENLNAQ